MMKRFFCLALITVGITTLSFAQSNYKSAIGIRLAPDSYYNVAAFSYKTFINDAGAFEFNGGMGSKSRYVAADNYRPFALSISASYQHHFNIPVDGLRWFVGGGLVGYNSFSSKGEVNGFGFGFFPTGGIDWKIPRVPINLTADYRPTIFFTRPDFYDSFHSSDFGVAVRYTFGNR